ncbi:hypothetical protein DPMN_092131 [Dreissena polymorpha]|uniref:Uncharacterized protein n=1 Tax=Dreissena polymorpha TaxID=45954 RepID=A0A9D4L0Z5_DREPO|nr:hypothetical protein DPMN_092131 [Dreissena polymorpha]
MMLMMLMVMLLLLMMMVMLMMPTMMMMIIVMLLFMMLMIMRRRRRRRRKRRRRRISHDWVQKEITFRPTNQPTDRFMAIYPHFFGAFEVFGWDVLDIFHIDILHKTVQWLNIKRSLYSF